MSQIKEKFGFKTKEDIAKIYLDRRKAFTDVDEILDIMNSMIIYTNQKLREKDEKDYKLYKVINFAKKKEDKRKLFPLKNLSGSPKGLGLIIPKIDELIKNYDNANDLYRFIRADGKEIKLKTICQKLDETKPKYRKKIDYANRTGKRYYSFKDRWLRKKYPQRQTNREEGDLQEVRVEQQEQQE